MKTQIQTQIPTQNKYNIVSQLQNYMFIQDRLDKITGFNGKNTLKLEPTQNQKQAQLVKPLCEPFFFPSQKDSLFWCFYIIKNDFVRYEMENITFIKEKNEKIQLITSIRNEISLLKQHKITQIEDVEDDLANKEKIQLFTFVALCIVSKISIIIINNRTCFELKMNDTDITHVIHKKDYSRYGIELNLTNEKIQDYRTNYFKIHNIFKPLLSIASYKVGELNEFISQLQIQLPVATKKATKPELYHLLTLTLNKN